MNNNVKVTIELPKSFIQEAFSRIGNVSVGDMIDCVKEENYVDLDSMYDERYRNNIRTIVAYTLASYLLLNQKAKTI